MMSKRQRGPFRKQGIDKVSQKSDTRGREKVSLTELRIYQEKPGDVPFLEFLAERKDTEKIDIRAALTLLRFKGHALRPPHNEHLGDQIYYLRINSEDGTYRVFYWPFGKGIVILGHGFSKKTGQCPPEQIERARKLRRRFESDPQTHTFIGDQDGD